jgi:CRP/FNR family cyclic AMP-dependent transcriptional regulator
MTSLAAIPAFGTLGPDALDALVADSRAVRYRAGTVVRPGGAVVLLLAGTMVVDVTGASGTRMWPARWDGPVIVDKAGVLSGAVPVGDLLATTACRVRLLPRARFLRLLDEEPAVRRHIVGRLAQEVLEQRARAVPVPAVARVAAWLAGATAWRGSQEELARLLGLSRVTVNRALARLAAAGAIRRVRFGIVVLDGERLKSFGGSVGR